MSGINIITTENKRLYPADIYDDVARLPIIDIDSIYEILYKQRSILVVSNQYDQYGDELKAFNGYLKKEDIKALYYIKDEENGSNLSEVMTLSEAAKKWGFSDGSTIRKAIERGKFETYEIKQAGDIWITTYSAMERVFGKIKNEENEFIIYDDFEGYLYNLCLKDFQKAYLKIDDYELNDNLYQYIKNVLREALECIKKGKKVIFKVKRNNKTKQIINTQKELLVYIKLLCRRRLMTEKRNERLIKELFS
jgi:hypothetical protein